MNIIILGLAITSSWGNGHATTYRGLVRALARRGHRVLFLERDQPWYAGNRDLPCPDFCRVGLYGSLADLQSRFAEEIEIADCVIVGSYVPEGIAVGEWVTRFATGVTAFYDIDTPITCASLRADKCSYLSRQLVPRYDLYLSFTGGPMLEMIRTRYGALAAYPLYCSVDPDLYFPEAASGKWDLGYLGTYCKDRQPSLERMLMQPARAEPQRQFLVAGPQYPPEIDWPRNVLRIAHLNPAEHRAFYNGQRYTLNLTRTEMIRAGYSPSVRLFEAAACGTPLISDAWAGLETFFAPGAEILIASTTGHVRAILREFSEPDRRLMADRARARVLREHTAAHRAEELEALVLGESVVLPSRPAEPEEVAL